MPIDDLPGSLTTTTRDKERDRWLRDYHNRDTTSDISVGTEPYTQASTIADFVMPLYGDNAKIADATDPNKASGALLKSQAEADGVFKQTAKGGAGSVICQASVGGGTIFQGDEIKGNNLRFHCAATALYSNGDDVPIVGDDTGVATNLKAGTVMQWSSPRPGIVANAVVRQQADGSGLSGGVPDETDEDYRKRWIFTKQNPPASGNDADIQLVAEKTTGVAVGKCFTIPGVAGPGSTCIMFTLVPSSTASSRIPNSTQIAAVAANVAASLPADYSIFSATLLAQNVDLALAVDWDSATPGWTDAAPWPAYYSTSTQAVVVSAATDATHFTLATHNANYSGVTPPVPGKTIGFYDNVSSSFYEKKILTVTGSGPWVVVCDTTNASSDLIYTPVVGQRACPWADSLPSLTAPLLTYFQTLGPGEQFSSFFDPGTRQRRSPRSPKEWPSIITRQGLLGALEIGTVEEVDVNEPTLPYATTVGTPKTTSYQLELRFIAAFPLTV